MFVRLKSWGSDSGGVEAEARHGMNTDKKSRLGKLLVLQLYIDHIYDLSSSINHDRYTVISKIPMKRREISRQFSLFTLTLFRKG